MIDGFCSHMGEHGSYVNAAGAPLSIQYASSELLVGWLNGFGRDSSSCLPNFHYDYPV